MGTPTPEVTIPTYARPQGGFASYSPPTAPSGLVVTPSTTSNALAWVSNSTNETGFQVERAAAAAGPFTVIATKTAGVTTHTDTGLLPARYYYRVKALRGAQSSSYTAVVSGLVVSVSIPSAPLLGSITNLTGTVKRVAISSFPSTADYVTREVSLNSGAYVSAGPDVLSGATFFDYDVGAATSWSFRSRAGNSAGLSTNYSNVVTGGSSIVAPAYTPFYTWSSAGRANGQAVAGNGWVSASNAQYSSDIAGPFGGAITGRFTVQTRAQQSNPDGAFFGGTLASGAQVTSAQIGAGDHLWFRMYHYFPSTFRFNQAPGGDGPSRLKWFRFDFSEDPNIRTYFDLSADGTTSDIRGGGTEPLGNVSLSGHYDPLNLITLAAWNAIQVHVFYSTNGTGYGEMWVGTTYVGRENFTQWPQDVDTQLITNAPSGLSLFRLILGDYWNAGPQAQQSMYLDEAIATTQTPTTLDSGGRPYISPSTRVSDFA